MKCSSYTKLRVRSIGNAEKSAFNVVLIKKPNARFHEFPFYRFIVSSAKDVDTMWECRKLI